MKFKKMKNRHKQQTREILGKLRLEGVKILSFIEEKFEFEIPAHYLSSICSFQRLRREATAYITIHIENVSGTGG